MVSVFDPVVVSSIRGQMVSCSIQLSPLAAEIPRRDRGSGLFGGRAVDDEDAAAAADVAAGEVAMLIGAKRALTYRAHSRCISSSEAIVELNWAVGAYIAENVKMSRRYTQP